MLAFPILAPMPPAVVDLAYPLPPSPNECDRAAVRAWAGHVAAGRLGRSAPPPAPLPAPGELRLASLARILGHAASPEGVR